jgi:hypothetical protein
MNAALEQDVQIASLGSSLDRVYSALIRSSQAPEPAEQAPAPGVGSDDAGFALHRLQELFGLSSFELDLLLLCAGAGLESRFLSACATAHNDPRATWPTLGLALQSLGAPHWSALSRGRPLRYWRLIEMETGPLLHAPLRIDERILQFLIGVPAVDERLEALVRPISLTTADNGSDRESQAISLAVRHWKRSPAGREPILLIGRHRFAREAFFTEICRQTRLQPCTLNASDIPAAPAEREQLARLWTRESALEGAALSIRTDEADSLRNLSAWLDLVHAPVAVEVQPGSPAEQLDGLRLHLTAMSTSERKRVWTEHLGTVAQQMNGYLDRIVEHFHFDEPGIQLSAAAAREQALAREGDNPGELAWRLCREHARRSLENLAQRIDPRSGWADLVLPAPQIETLRQVAVHVRQRSVVNDRWGFADRYSRGLGLSALFSGSSGTGKTMAAEILAGDLDLDLYRIDLASVVSKYIGETEKNLRKVFDAAEESGAILLFDEADALFGKRSEVRDSHDRYANLEISYLLQRMESYRGVAILTTNMQHALDPAFMRRIRFIVQFPFPDAASRARIWERVFPCATPVDPLAFDQLAQLNVSGGVIRNIAMHAAFLAAEDGAPVGARHILAAARTEYSKMDKPLTAAETRGWA